MARTKKIRVSILKRVGRDFWQMQYRHPVTGRKVMRSTEETSKKEAMKAAGKWEEELREGREKKQQGKMPWSEFRTRYEDEVVAALAPMTDRKISSVLNAVESIINPQRLSDVDAESITAYQKKLRDDKKSENTIKGHLAHLRAALAWAVGLGLISDLPKIPRQQRAKATRMMKGRPITTEEFERMLDKVEAGLLDDGTEKKPKVSTNDKAVNGSKPKRKRSDKAKKEERERLEKKAKEVSPSWKQLLRGLWWSGLRLKESLDLHWNDQSHLSIDLTCRHPMLRIPAEKEKGHKDRLMPLAPEFATFLLAIPESKRHGFVFDPQPQRVDKKTGRRLSAQQVSSMVTRIGKAANVKVNDGGKSGPKFASAHDLRRAFGTRWAARVMPQVLMELMRHETIETTMRYYVGRNAQATADILWQAHGKEVGDTLGDTSQQSEKTSS